MAKKQIAAQENISPNLIPMVDIMFLLLLFFMLGADMGQRELEEVKMPKATAAQPDDQNDNPKELPRLNVNVFHDVPDGQTCRDFSPDKDHEGEGICSNEEHWKIGIKGNEFNRMGEPLAGNPRGAMNLHDYLLEQANMERDPTNVQISDRKVMIRADKAALYGFVQRAMNACAEVGIYKVEFGAVVPVKEGAKAETP